MTQPIPNLETEDQSAEKARMLITILGNDFTRNSAHPFFRTLTETAAKPAPPRNDQPDISRALRNLMSHLSSQSPKAGLQTEAPGRRPAIDPETYASPDQHPALIASTLSKMEPAQRRAVLRTLSGPLACRVLVYMREIEDKSA